ncbi:MAG: phytanoyl-CoA dioxygenase family protein, partial [Candidatus Dormibacteria bacterium]
MTTSHVDAQHAALPRDQVEAYHRDGFLLIPRFLDSAELERLRAAYESSSVQRALRRAKGSGPFFEITVLDDIFKEYAAHPRLTPLLIQLLGAGVELQHSKFTSK